MARFLTDDDYSVLIRSEIKRLLAEDDGGPLPDKILKAEDMAIAQIKNYLAGKYDTAEIFRTDRPDQRNPHIVMTVIDMALYHLYTSISPDKIPQHRSDRYQDAIEWLKAVATGEVVADLPRKTSEDGEPFFGIKISSKYPPENNRW